MREPAVAGRFYPAGRDALLSDIRSCFTDVLGPGMPGESTGERRISAVVAPHAGYRASGMAAAHSFKAIAEDGLPEAYVIIGPDHYGIPYDFALCGEAYRTPLGPCMIHDGIAERLADHVTDSPAAHRLEHSIEVEVPFIQYIDPDPRIVPVIMHDQSPAAAERLAAYLREACEGFDVVYVASSDLSHYIPKEKAWEIDGSVLDSVCALDVAGLYDAVRREHASVCGYGPMATAILAAGPSRAELKCHIDSWDSLGYDRSQVVGYGSVAMYR
jgi:MEMO1 family protein